MKRIHSALNRRKWSESSGLDDLFGERVDVRAIFVVAAALLLISDCAFGQTTRTGSSASSTSKIIPFSSSTSPNSPCSPNNPTSPCYSANAPRNPCYSAVAPDEPCSTTTTPNSAAPAVAPPSATTLAIGHAFTADQAKAQIEAKEYSKVSGLRKDAKGIWRGKAEKDGLPVNVILDANGGVTDN